MTVLVTPDEMRAAEAAAVAAGRSEPELMRAAATRIADWIDTHITRHAKARRVAVALVGPGNNGGDALVALALLIERGWRCAAVMLGRESIGHLPAPDNLLDKIELLGVDCLKHADVIIDGVYGIGGRASLPEAVAVTFHSARDLRIACGTPLVAIDVPSGVDAGSGAACADAFLADVTLCLGLPKIGLIREPAASCVGELVVLDIGIDPPSGDTRPQLIDEASVRPLFPRRRASAHKHDTGTVLVIGGAPTYFGAPRLSAEAAARAGAGLVAVAAPEAVVHVIAGHVPELVVVPLDASADRAATQVLEWVDQRGGHISAFVIGPGLGQTLHATQLLDRLLADVNKGLFATRDNIRSVPSLVLDADALNWIAKRGRLPDAVRPRCAVLTPHAGELGRLMGMPRDEMLSDPIAHAVKAAETFKQTVIFKTGYSVVATVNGHAFVSPRAAPELATAGTGDVLAGLVGGLLAQGLAPDNAARAALYIGSQAGRIACRQRGLAGVIARDVIEAIPMVMRALCEPMWASGELSGVREEM